jgi:hypothetical protein
VRRRPPPAVPPGSRTRVTLVTASWGDVDDERCYAVRCIAGALASRAQVRVVHLVSRPIDRVFVQDGAFEVRRVRTSPSRPFTSAVALAALGVRQATHPLPGVAGHGLLQLEGGASDEVGRVVEETAPEVVVLAGIQQGWAATALPALTDRARCVVFPLAGDDPRLELPGYRDVLAAAQTVCALGAGEVNRVEAALAAGLPVRAASTGGAAAQDAPRLPAVVEVPLAVRVNPAARRQRLVGLSKFDNYVLVLRGFPAGTVARQEPPDYVRLRDQVPGVGVADVSHECWRVVDGQRRLVVPAASSRVNLWRLMAHAIVTVDLRPGGLFGREAIESMLLGAPVIAPAGSSAGEVAGRSGGGVVLADEADLPDLVGSLTAGGLRDQLVERGTAYVTPRHGDQAAFVERTVAAVLAG